VLRRVLLSKSCWRRRYPTSSRRQERLVLREGPASDHVLRGKEDFSHDFYLLTSDGGGSTWQSRSLRSARDEYLSKGENLLEIGGRRRKPHRRRRPRAPAKEWPLSKLAKKSSSLKGRKSAAVGNSRPFPLCSSGTHAGGSSRTGPFVLLDDRDPTSILILSARAAQGGRARPPKKGRALGRQKNRKRPSSKSWGQRRSPSR